jgi:hypothetical protein
MELSMKKFILALLFGLLAAPALQAADAQAELKVQVLSSISSEPRECYICHQPLTNPITLPCGHDDKFDAMCLLTYAVAVTRARQRIPGGQSLPIACPLCEEVLVQEEEPEQQGEVLQEDEGFEEGQPQENPEMAEILRQRRVEALDAEAQLQIEQMDGRMHQHRVEMFNWDLDEAYYFGLPGIALLAASTIKMDTRVRLAAGLGGMAFSLVPAVLLFSAYCETPLPAREKLQQTKEFILRNKLKVGALTALATWGLVRGRRELLQIK